jgi:hypothetical protein
MAPEALPHSGRVPEQRFLSPEIHRRWWRSCETLLEILSIPLGFSVGRLLIGEGASSGVDQGGLTMGGRSQGLGHTPLLCGQPPALVRSSVLFRENMSSGTCFVKFREYFLCSFSETQKQQKIGNWHCGILLVG